MLAELEIIPLGRHGKIDDRTDKPGLERITQKVASLEAKVGKPLKQ